MHKMLINMHLVLISKWEFISSLTLRMSCIIWFYTVFAPNISSCNHLSKFKSLKLLQLICREIACFIYAKLCLICALTMHPFNTLNKNYKRYLVGASISKDKELIVHFDILFLHTEYLGKRTFISTNLHF